jgi:survival of motor neuron-related-splicing factor 30
LKAEIEEAITATESLIEELRPAPPPEAPREPSPPTEKPKWSKENHPAFQPGYRRPGAPPPEEESAPVTFKVNDTVLARWTSGDKAFYPARITSITGSSANPVYYVTFKSYGNTESVRGPDIKPMQSAESKKRKVDGSPVTPSTPTSAPSGVISAAADINPALATAAKMEPSKVSDGPPKPPKIPKKIKAKKELEAGKNKWQDFSAKGKLGKSTKKESMFRTGDSVTARGNVLMSYMSPLGH